MTPGKKYTLFTSMFYLLLLPLIPLLNRYSPSGPCTIGLGMLLLLITPILATIAFLYSFIGLLRGNRSFTGPTIINAVVVLTMGVLMNTDHI